MVLYTVRQQFHSGYTADVENNLRESPTAHEILTAGECSRLPQPVQNYLRFTNVIGKPKVNNFRVLLRGQLRADEKSPWMPFESEQYNFMKDPARLFFLKATMKGLPVAGYHRYAGAKAKMDIRLLSLVKVQYMDGELMDVAETVTFFNDMCVMAPATLIDKRISWLETEGNKVKAVFSNGAISISAWLYFDQEGKLVNFESDDRYNAAEKKVVKWLTPLGDYKEFGGVKVAGSAAAVYRQDKNFTYGKFETISVEYNVKQE